MYDTHSLAEWFASLCLGLVPLGAIGIALAFAEADAAWFDRRPAARRALATAHQGLVHLGHDLNRAAAPTLRHARAAGHSSAEAWRDLAALLLLLTTSPNGATHV